MLEVKSDDIIIGKKDAPVTIIEYSSLSCPHCAHFHKEILPAVQKEWIDTGKAKLVLRPFPLNKPALDGAKLVACVEPARAATFEGVLFKMQDQWAYSLKDDVESLKGIAAVGGVPAEQFDSCMADKASEKKILEAVNDAKNLLEVASTPTFFINGEKLEGAQPAEAFSKAITKAMAGKAKVSGPDLDDLRSRVDSFKDRTAEPVVGDVAPHGAGGLAFRFAIDIVAGVGVGTAVGYFIDKWLGTLPLFLLICLCLGTAGSFMTIYRANLRYAADIEKDLEKESKKQP